MQDNSGSLQQSNNLFFSQKIKGSSEKKDSNLFSSEKHPNTTRNNLQKTYEIQNIPKLIIPNNLVNKDNNLNETSSQNELNNQNKTFSNKYYSLNQNNSLLNEQQSYSQIMKDNNYSSNNDKLNSGKMSISELNDEKSYHNKNKKNIYINDINFSGKKYFSENNYGKKNYINIDIGNDLGLNLVNKDNNSNNENKINFNENINNDNNGKEEDYNEEYENIEENENKNIEENENEYIDDNKNNKDLEEFLIYNENKDKMSQNENNYILFGTNNSNNKEINYDLVNNEISQSNEKNKSDSKNTMNKRNFFSKIIDIEILIDTNEIYSKPWSQLINEICTHLELNDDSIQLISLGAQHTLCLSNQGKLFSFGWNKYSQCDIKNKSDKKINLDFEKIEEIMK